jgi:hypothetical protein
MALDERFLDQAKDFITETLDAEIPDLNTDGGSAVSDILANGGSVIAATTLQEVDNVVQSRDISDPEAISEAEVDVFLENLLVERNQGNTSRGFVDVHFEQRTSREFPGGLRFTTADGSLIFVTATDLTFNSEDYFQDAQRGTFFVRVPVFADEPGLEFDVEPGDISVILDNRTDVVFVSNSAALFGGLPSESNTQAVRSARRAVSTRTQINVDGAVFAAQQLFGQKLLDLLVIGNGDEEMIRDELHDQGDVTPKWTLGPEGTATGVHVGGRTDLYNWYRNLNYVEETVDVFADMLLNVDAVLGVSTEIEAVFPAGGTGTVPATGKLTLDLGGVAEETFIYTSFALDIPTGVYTFDIVGTPTLSHSAGVSVRVANTGEIAVAVDGDVTVLPVLQIASIRVLDPITFEPIGDPVPRTDEDSLTPGWYFTDFNAQNHMSAKETRTIVLDEKRDKAGNAAQSGVAGVVSFVGGNVNFTDAAADFTGYQGRTIELTGTFGTTTRTIIQVSSSTVVILSGDTLGAEGGVTWDIAENFGDLIQFPVRISYYTHTEIQEFQDFLDARRTRITASEILSRAFQPVFVDFNYRYRGTGGVSQVRENLLEVLRTSSEAAIGESEGADFDYSDLVAAGYEDGFANFVETPFEVVVTRVNQDGSEDKRFVNPAPGTVNDLVIDAPLTGGEVFIETVRPAQIGESTIPSRGHLLLGSTLGVQEKLDYEAVAQDGSSFTFVLRDGQNVGNAHPAGEPLQATVLGYDPANVITDGVITDERIFRPYLGVNVLVEKIE